MAGAHFDLLQIKRLLSKVKINIKQSHYRTGQPLRVPGGWGSQISRQSAHEGGKVVSPTHRPLLPPPPPPRNIPGTYFFRGWVNPRVIVRPEGLTPSGIEHATFRFVAQCRNQLPHRVPKRLLSKKYISRNIPSDYRLTLWRLTTPVVVVPHR